MRLERADLLQLVREGGNVRIQRRATRAAYWSPGQLRVSHLNEHSCLLEADGAVRISRRSVSISRFSKAVPVNLDSVFDDLAMKLLKARYLSVFLRRFGFSFCQRQF